MLALIVIGCGKKTSVQEKGNEYPIPQVQVKRPLCIKGFSLGMSKANARMALNNNGLYLHDTNYSASSVGDLYSYSAGFRCDWARTNGGSLFLVYNPDKKLVHVEMGGGVINSLFNVHDLDAKQFVQMFMREYQIDEMKYFRKSTIAGWRYTDEDSGNELVLYFDSRGEKMMTFRLVPKATQRKFD